MTFEARLLIPGYAGALPYDPPTADFSNLVDGVNCKNGHFNDPGVHFCQRCGISMAQLTLVPRRGMRPSLGVLLFDDSSTFRLDANYVVGREPHDLRGGARAIKLIYEISGLSRQHARVSLSGWLVQVTDLRSSNGTVVIEPGGKAQTLAPGEPTTIRPGTQVKLAKRWFRYESHRAGVR